MTTLIPKYDQGATSAVNRPFNQKLAEIVSVKDFGAVGNGTTDDTAAIQAAIDYLNPYVYSSPMNYNQGGGTVYFPAGNYLVSSTIKLPNNVILAGTGCQTYQANLTAANPAQGSTIFAAATFTGFFVIDTAGYNSSGVRYTSSAIPPAFNT
jgi:polygalacturonase